MNIPLALENACNGTAFIMTRCDSWVDPTKLG